MKKILAIVLALVMALSLVACTKTADAPVVDDGGEDVVENAGLNVSVFIYDYADTYIASVRAAMEEGYKAAGLTATFYDAASDQGKQTNQVETAIGQGTDLLVVNIVTTGSDDAAMNVVNLAKDADIPVIFFNREVSNDVVNSYDKCAFVGTEPAEAGVMQGELVAEIIGDKLADFDLNGDGKLSYIMFKGEIGNPEAELRTSESVKRANELLGDVLTYYDPANTDLFQACNWATAEAQDAMATALGTNPFSGPNPIEIVFANNDDMALGAIEALNEAGYNKGADGDRIPVVGVDATDAAKAAIADGKMDGSIKQDAQGMADTVVALSQNIANGEELMANTGSYNVDSDAAKIRVPYAFYQGE